MESIDWSFEMELFSEDMEIEAIYSNETKLQQMKRCIADKIRSDIYSQLLEDEVEPDVDSISYSFEWKYCCQYNQRMIAEIYEERVISNRSIGNLTQITRQFKGFVRVHRLKISVYLKMYNFIMDQNEILNYKV